MFRFSKFAVLLAFLLLVASPLRAQDPKPLTNTELVKLLYQLPKDPDKRDEIVDEIRKRGIGFPLTDGFRSLVATKSGNDAILRRTLEEAERRRVNPVASSLPSEEEGKELLERTRNVTLAAANAMPDFLVKQLIRRSLAYGSTTNWKPADNLTVAVGYRAGAGEQYRVLSKDGMPFTPPVGEENSPVSKQVGGAMSSGVEYISMLADIFKPEAQTEFRMVDTDVVLGKRTIVFEYVVKRENSTYNIKFGKPNGTEDGTSAGSRGRMWIDRELDRVVRFEQIATEIPAGFPVTATQTLIDYDWVSINERKYLLPIHSEVLMTSFFQGITVQNRNDVRFRSYQKFSAELKVIDEVDGDEPLDNPPPVPTLVPKKP